MDMEWSESRCEHNQDSRFESTSPDAVYREEKMDDLEDGVSMVIDTKDKEKSRDFGKHWSKDMKKKRREEKGHGSKDREWAKIDYWRASSNKEDTTWHNLVMIFLSFIYGIWFFFSFAKLGFKNVFM